MPPPTAAKFAGKRDDALAPGDEVRVGREPVVLDPRLAELRVALPRLGQQLLLRAEGWTLPTDAACRDGTTLAGGTQCELRVAPGSRGTLVVFRSAPGEGVQPQEVRMAVGTP